MLFSIHHSGTAKIRRLVAPEVRRSSLQKHSPEIFIKQFLFIWLISVMYSDKHQQPPDLPLNLPWAFLLPFTEERWSWWLWWWAMSHTPEFWTLVSSGDFRWKTVFGRPFVKRFALCYQTVVCPVCPVCDVSALWPNGWVDQDETWHACRPRPWPHCVRWGPNSLSLKGAQPPTKFLAHICCAKRLHGSRCHLIWS